MKKMKRNKKLERLMLLDLKRGIGNKILIVLEIVVCTLLLAVAISGFAGSNHLNYLFKDIDGIYMEQFNLGDGNEELKKQVESKIIAENTIGKIEIFASSTGQEKFYVYRYNNAMLENVPLKLSKGKTFSNNYATQEYREIILNYQLKDSFEIGQIITDEDLGTITRAVDGVDNSTYKVVGFLQNNYGMLNHQYTSVNKNFGIIKSEQEKPNNLNGTMIFTDLNTREFLQKYGVLGIYEGQGDNNSFFRVCNTEELLENNLSAYKQIMSFFQMFLVIALGVYLSTIISSVIIKFNDNLQFNKNLIKIGVTKKEFLATRLINVLIISFVCIILSLILLLAIVAPNILLFNDMAILTGGMMAGCMAITIVSYLILELIDLYATYYRIEKERK